MKEEREKIATTRIPTLDQYWEGLAPHVPLFFFRPRAAPRR